MFSRLVRRAVCRHDNDMIHSSTGAGVGGGGGVGPTSGMVVLAAICGSRAADWAAWLAIGWLFLVSGYLSLVH